MVLQLIAKINASFSAVLDLKYTSSEEIYQNHVNIQEGELSNYS